MSRWRSDRGQIVRYFRFAVRHPFQYRASERHRRAVNLIGDSLADDGPIRINMSYESDHWQMYVELVPLQHVAPGGGGS